MTTPLPGVIVPDLRVEKPTMNTVAASDGIGAGMDEGAELSTKPVRLQPSLFPHKEPTVYIEYAPFIGL
jgi:hypothetical protein